MPIRSNGSNDLGVKCEKSDSNQWVCEFPDENNDTQAKIVYQGSKDGDLELLKKQISPEYQDKEEELLKKAKKGVKVNPDSGSTSKDPFKGPRE